MHGASGGTGWAVSSAEGVTLEHVFGGKEGVINISHCPQRTGSLQARETGELKVVSSSKGTEMSTPDGHDRTISFQVQPGFSQTVAPLPAAPAEIAGAAVGVVPACQDIKSSQRVSFALINPSNVQVTEGLDRLKYRSRAGDSGAPAILVTVGERDKQGARPVVPSLGRQWQAEDLVFCPSACWQV